jgi:DNA-binding SARP family transcriptional activator
VTPRGPGSDTGAGPPSVVRLGLLGGFLLSIDRDPVRLQTDAQRVLAFLAMQDRPARRAHVAATLWLDAPEPRAAASLRSALWKLRRTGAPLIETYGDAIELASRVTVDLRDGATLARLASNAPSWWRPADEDVELLKDDLLPGWYDDWVLEERERYRQLRLHALESLCRRLADLGRFGTAVQAGLAVVAADPLRETGQRTLIEAFLAEGNRSEAVAQYSRFRTLLVEELGTEPSPDLRALIEDTR